MRDVDPEILRLAFRFLSPDGAEQLSVRHDLAGVLHQDAEERILGRSQLYFLLVEPALAGRYLDA